MSLHSVPMGPQSDPIVVETINHVGPPPSVRQNPKPKASYDLVVIGAGVAGLLRFASSQFRQIAS